MFRKYCIFSILICFCPTAFVFAWSSTGHGIVGDIAYRYLSPLAKSRVNYYIQGRSVHQACTWMDSVKSIRAYKYLTPRHYVDIDKGATYDTTSTSDVVYELNRILGELSHMNNLNDSMITQYTLELFHLVGDIHQPLHCGYGTDGGGNGTQVTFLGQPTNLHSAWDYSLISFGNVNLFSCLAANHFTQSEIQTIQQINVFGWMNESMQLVDTCYYPENSNNLDSNYMTTRLPIVQQQLLKAGIRLAYVLETLFGANSPLPVNLLSFDIQSSNGANTLFWETGISKNISRFLIERSNDGINFKTVGRVESSFANRVSAYHFEDVQTQSQVYYRLKMVFKDGSNQYSAILKADWGNVEKQPINISPNPAKSFLNVRFTESNSKAVTLQLLGIDGKVYKTKQYQLNPGKVSVNFDLNGLVKGTYILSVEGLGTQKVLVE